MSERNIVIIDDVDTANRQATVIDNRNGKFPISWITSTGSMLVPLKGETWTIEKIGYQWLLCERYDSPDEAFPLESLQPGDNRIHAERVIYLDAKETRLNGQTIGVPYWDKFDIPLGGSWQVNLTYAPISIKTVQAFSNHTLVDPTLLTVNQTTLIGSPMIKFPRGPLVVYYQYKPNVV